MAHLTEQDRARIVSLLAERRSLRQIALELVKSPSTIKREILKHRERSEKTGRFLHYNPCAECRKCDVPQTTFLDDLAATGRNADKKGV